MKSLCLYLKISVPTENKYENIQNLGSHMHWKDLGTSLQKIRFHFFTDFSVVLYSLIS